MIYSGQVSGNWEREVTGISSSSQEPLLAIADSLFGTMPAPSQETETPTIQGHQRHPTVLELNPSREDSFSVQSPQYKIRETIMSELKICITPTMFRYIFRRK